MSRQIATLIAGALYDFGGFITTRKARLVASSSDDAAPVCETIVEFIKLRQIDDAEPVVNWWRQVGGTDESGALVADEAEQAYARFHASRRTYSEKDAFFAEIRTVLAKAETKLAEQQETYEAVARGRLRLIRDLDVALNGAAGAAEQASMSDLIAQVTRQQCVQILNLPDGMRLNFRAPDGRRATLSLAYLVDDLATGMESDQALAATMRDAIADYPVAGVPE